MPSAVPRARAWRQPRSARVTRLLWAVPSNSAGRGRARAYPSGRTPAIDIARLSSCATRPPAFLRRLHPETSRHREPGSLEINAAPSDRRITTRRRLAGDVRRTRGRRPSARGAVPASVPGAISAQVPPSSPPAATRAQHDSPTTAHSTPHAHHLPSAHITMDAPRHQNAGKTIHPTIYFVTNLFTTQGYQPTIHRCAPQPGRPPRMRPCISRPCRCAREAAAHGARARARGRVRERDICTRACPTPHPPRRACLRTTPLALAIVTCERDASPVLLTDCALLPWCRQPQMREVGLDGHRALDISVTIGRRDVDTTVTRIRP